MNKTTLKKLNQRGIQRKIADHFNISAQAVSLWFCNREIPPKRVLGVEKITGIPREKLSPKIYPS